MAVAAHPVQAVEIGETVDVPLGRSLAVRADDPGQVAVHEVTELVMEIVDRLNHRDVDGLRSLYVADDHAVIFSGGQAWAVRGVDKYLNINRKFFATLSGIEVTPKKMQVQYLGNVAVATITGENKVNFSPEAQTRSVWRWTLVVRNSGEDGWKVSHEHFSTKADD